MQWIIVQGYNDHFNILETMQSIILTADKTASISIAFDI
jgi:hypothetical protein